MKIHSITLMRVSFSNKLLDNVSHNETHAAISTSSSFPVTWRMRASRKRKRAPCGYLVKHWFSNWPAYSKLPSPVPERQHLQLSSQLSTVRQHLQWHCVQMWVALMQYLLYSTFHRCWKVWKSGTEWGTTHEHHVGGRIWRVGFPSQFVSLRKHCQLNLTLKCYPLHRATQGQSFPSSYDNSFTVKQDCRLI